MSKQKQLRTVPAGGPFEPPLRRTALALLIAACFNAAHANPVLPQVVHGQATFNQQGNLFTITNTPNTIINWQSFSVNQGEITRFVQQNAGSSVLNRITGQDPSKILGSLQSNGKVFLINPNGVLFGRDARVDVAGLVASSLALSNQDFLAGKMNFNAGDTAGAVINQGAINAVSGGQILLIAPNVENSGIITAPNGDVLLAAGHSVQLADAANPDLRVVLSAPADQAINVGQIVAQGGRIGMAGALLNQRGVLNANSAVLGENGKIVLKATGKALLENGSVTTASNTAGKGGEVTVLGEQVGVLGNAQVDASGALGGGTVLLGGDYQGKNAAIPNARQVAVDSGASIKADAIVNGDGGKVIVWGNETARVYGSISARGGAASGNGGLVETSGHYLDVDGIRIDTGASRGKRGNWLLDPYDIDVVSSSSGQLENFDQFADGPATGSSTIGAGTISSAQTNVTLQATHRITFTSAINIVKSGVGLTALAGESIVVNAAISAQGGNITLSANDATSGSAYGLGSDVILHAPINTYGGAAYLSGASITSNGSGWVNVGNGNLTLRASDALGGINLGGGGDQLLGSGAYGQLVTLQADNISFGGRLVFGGATGYAEVIAKPLTDGRQVSVGSKPGNGLGLTNTELNQISANTVTIGSATAGNLTVSAPVDLVNLAETEGVRSLNLQTGGNLTVSNMVALRQDGSNLRATAGGALSVNTGGGLYAGGTVSLVADNMTLGGAAQSISTASNGTVNLRRRSNDGSIEVGTSAADSGTSLGLSTAELGTIAAPTIAIGSSEFSGTLDVKGGLDLTGLTTLNTLALNSGGGINLNSALAVAKDLTLSGGSINATGAVNVGGNFLLDRGNWEQNAASLPAFFANGFSIGNATFLRATGGDGSVAAPYQIADVYGLQGVGKQINNKNYLLAGDIDASGTASWNGGAGFTPLFGGDEYAYTGIFDGGNHGIQGLVINGSANSSYFGSGLFARLQGGTIRNLAMLGGSVTGGNNVGALVGNNSEGTLSNVSSSMAVSGNTNVGGLVGANGGTISNATATGNVTGLAGGMGNGSVSGSSIGGLVGSNNSDGSISVARASGAVTGPGEKIGGLVGNNDGAISQAYATGGVGGGANVGGLVGRNGGTIADAYAAGAIGLASNSDQTLTRENVGGVIGWSVAGSSASRLYFSGTVSGNGVNSGTLGAVVGRADPGAGVGPAFFNYETAGTYFDQGGSTGRSTADMNKQSSFGGFNFGENAVWRIYDGYTTPMLKAFLTPLQVTASGAASRVYDGQVAGVDTLGYVGLLNGDLGASGTASYGNALNVGNYALGGLWSTKYDISYAGTTTLAITPRALSVILGGSKVYDSQLGFANATLSLGNTVSGDTLGVTGSAQFVDKNAGTAKAVNLSGLALSGNELGNYSLAETASGTAEISRASLSLASVSAASKVYDGSTGASLSATFEGVFGTDQVQLSGASANFVDKNVGAGKDVNYSVAGGNLGGSDAGNYVLNTSTGKTSAGITARTLDLGFTGVNKTYDGGVAAAVTLTDNRVAGDVLTATATGAFADKNAGAGKTVTVQNASLSGTDAANYTLGNTGGTATADIAQRALNLAFAGVNKVYDGGTTAVVTVTDNRVTGDLLTATASGAFADKNAGANKAVTVQNASLSGTDAANYTLGNTGGTATADITQRTLNLAFAGVNKVYDGSTTAAVTVTDNRVTGDLLTASATGAFADKNAGAGKTVTVQNASLSGTDAANYTLGNTGGTATADITQRTLNLAFAGVNKVYDGGTTAAVTVTDNRVTGDVLTASATGAFADKNAGAGKTVTVQNASLSGLDAANYTLGNTGGTATADITQRALNLAFAGVNKVYDGATNAAVTVTDNRVTGDVLTASATGTFADKNAGAGKTVTVQSASLSGTDAANYALGNTGGTATADIAQRTLNLAFAGVNKVYDGGTTAAVTVTDNRVTGDLLTASATGTFADKNAGAGKTVTVQNASLSGLDAANYVLAKTDGTATAAITPRVLTATVSGSKVYDGGLNLDGASFVLANVVAGESLAASLGAGGSVKFDDKNAGTGKPVNATGISLAGNELGNYTLATTASGLADITPRTLTASVGGSKVYDGKLSLNGASFTLGNAVAGDTVNASGSVEFTDKNAGSGKSVKATGVSLAGSDKGNYTVADTATGTAEISRASLALATASAAGKVYDGTVAASLSGTFDGLFGDDQVQLSNAAASFVDKNVGTRKIVDYSVTGSNLAGRDAGNYILGDSKGSASADITARALNLGFAGVNKTYDGGTAASVTITDDRIGNDVLTATATGTFDGKNAGTGKTVTVKDASLSGADAANYTLANVGAEVKADITQRELNLDFAGVNKIYDGGKGAAVAISDDRIANDVLTATAIAAFADKNAGADKAVTVQNASLSGADAANYVLKSTTGVTSAAITQRELALGFAAAGKTYDGSTAATVAVTDNRVAGDVLTATATGAFADKNAGANKAVTVQNTSLSGTDAANYILKSTTGAASAAITQRELALGFAAAGKTYDGSTAATVAVTDNRVAGDVLTATASGAFADKNAGVNKSVTVQNASLSGTDAANYVLSSTTGASSATITQRELALSFAAAGKTYDGSTAATVAVTDNRVAGDVLTATASGVFADKNAGANKAVTVQNASLSGVDAANYVLNSTTGATSATITQRELALGFAVAGKTYDGNTAATVGITDNRIAGDVLTATASGAFADKNAGANKTVAVQNASLSGADAANYVLTSTTGATSATITQRELALGITAAGKTYDGNTAATVAITDNRVAGDVLTATASGAFADKNAGANKVVTVQNASLSGTDAANYVLASTTGATSASIAQRALALSFAAAGKIYDGSTAATVAITDNRVAGDMLTATATGAFADKNAGNNKVVTVQNASLSGVDAANYVLNSTTGVSSATITQRELALGFAAAGKTYDGNTAATVAVTDNRIAGDALNVSASGAFADKNAGNNKVVMVQNASLSGADSGNYTLATTGGTTTAAIAQRALTLGYTGIDKVYDGVTGAQVAISDNRIAGDVLTASASAAFADKNAGSGKAVAVQGATLSGTDAGNYRLAATGGATSASIARAALTLASVSASDKVYDGTQVASVSGTVAGVIGQDTVSLAGGSGTFADRNFGTGKTVAVSGFQLAGSDAGNYALTSNSGVAQASIAQRALSTWIGAAGGLWSDAANWEGGVAPSGANVLAADFAASTGNVVYTAAAGDTVLDSLTSRGGLNLSGGSLSVNNVLTVANYAQSGGLLGGLGNVTVGNSFSQSAGAINIGGNLAVTQAAGDLRFAALTANAISLNAGAGAISQSGAVVARSLATQSQTGTVLNDAGNRVKTFSASNSGAGGIALTNTSAPDVLVLGSLSTGAGDVRIESTGGIESHAINANSGNVTLIAHSPVNVQGVVQGNDVTVDASTDVAFGDGARVNAARAIAVTAGTGVTFAGAATLDVQATGGINVLAKNGDLTAAETVRINSRGAPVSLLAPNGRVTVPASVLVAGPVTTPVLPPAVIVTTNNYVPAISEQYNPLNQLNTPNNVTSPLLASAAPTVSTKETKDDLQNSIKKTFCN
ncbi:YDG domain-containing protein [Janthinobacterium sp. J1-1]|uniref:YDG domain-containing protein n=1 Tax=Janthinobacterium sp. J1-1 TaxID=3065910 RepID=UPI002811D1EA|nr:YDG domain-containing protein [Janthinobacterium sp. J1-1]